MPTLLVNLSMVTPAEEGQVVQPGRTPVGPELQVMRLAPRRRPIATRDYAELIAGDKRSSSRWRRGSPGMRSFALQFTKPSNPGNRRVTGEAPHRLYRDQSASLELTRRRSIDAGQRLDTRLDNQLRPGRQRIRPASGQALARLDKGVVRPLARRAVIIL